LASSMPSNYGKPPIRKADSSEQPCAQESLDQHRGIRTAPVCFSFFFVLSSFVLS
jgi:hypothetical protein